MNTKEIRPINYIDIDIDQIRIQHEQPQGTKVGVLRGILH